MRILVVNDSDDGRDVADAMLAAGGYGTVGAGSAREAYGFLQIGVDTQEPPRVDAVLLDIVMPGIDGIEACAHIRKDPRHQDVPIIMVTAIEDMTSLASAFVAGATDYIMKPLNRTEILARVRSALKMKSELEYRRAREKELLGFMSIWVDRRAVQWVDPTTGLFVGEIAEAYLIANSNAAADREISIIALAVDKFEAYRSQSEDVAARIMAQVAEAVRGTAADIGAVAAVYSSGIIVIIAPDAPLKKAVVLGELLRNAISRLPIVNPEAFGKEYATASISVVTGRPGDWSDGAHLLMRALAAVPQVSAAGGNRVVPAL